MENTSLFEKQIHPLKQLVVFLIPTVLALLAIYLYQNGKEEYAHSSLAWELCLSLFLMFALFNSVMSLSYKDQNNYWLYSTIAFVILVVVGAGGSYLITDLTERQFVVFKWLYFVFGFGYLVFLSIVRMMRKIVELAQRKDKRMMGHDD